MAGNGPFRIESRGSTSHRICTSQLVYQSTVFISRSSISLGLAPLPEKLLPLPAVAQFLILVTLIYESAIGIFSEDHPASSIIFVFLLISIEGICGGLA